MNYSTAIFLISDQARAVLVTYEEDGGTTLFKTLDPEIKVDDFVTVPTNTRHHMTVCKVVEVDVDVDFDSDRQVDWIIGVVDPANFADLKRQEDEAITKIKSAEKKRKRDELRASLMADAGEGLKTLAICSVAETEE